MAFRVLRVVNVSKQLAEEEPRAPPEERRASFRKKFRRAGSLGLPFVPESEIPNIREYWSSVDDEAEPVFKQDQENNGSLLTVILMTRPGSSDLSTALSIVEKFNAKSVHIESRKPQHANVDCLEVLLILEVPQAGNAEAILKTMKDCGLQVTEPKTHASLVRTMSPAYSDDVFGHTAVDDDLDIAAKRVLMYGTELDADHPGFKDTVYRQRRLMFADLALNYRHGQPIPRVEYTPEETKTWGTMYRELRRLHTLYACSEYLENFRLMEEKCGYSENNIPQLEDVSKFLKGKTGFQVRPVAGYLSSRDFLASLAFRVFPCTQYIRHPTDPFYTPEPDCCHELMGHMPLFAEADFAQFSQEIGLASLGATDDDVQKLATLYFFTVEFGLCKQDNQLKVYGAGLLSSAAELQHAVEGSPETLAFDPDRVIQQECLITTYQTTYFYTESFEEAQDKIRMFTSNMRRPFVTRYNAYTESIELLNDKTALTAAVNSLRSTCQLDVEWRRFFVGSLSDSQCCCLTTSWVLCAGTALGYNYDDAILTTRVFNKMLLLHLVYHGSIGMMEKLGWTIEFSALLNKKQSEKTCNSDSKGCYDEGKKKSGEDVTLHWRRRLYDDLLFPKDEKTIVAPNNALILFEDAEKDQVDKGIRVKVYRDGKEQESHLIKDKTQVVTFEKKKEEHKSESSGDSGTSYASNCAYQPQSCPG